MRRIICNRFSRNYIHWINIDDLLLTYFFFNFHPFYFDTNFRWSHTRVSFTSVLSTARHICFYTFCAASGCFSLHVNKTHLQHSSACTWHSITLSHLYANVISIHKEQTRDWERERSIALVFAASDSMALKYEPSDRILCNYAKPIKAYANAHNNETGLVQFIAPLFNFLRTNIFLVFFSP